MDRKISFAVNDVKLVDECNDSQFAIVSIDAFASGKNRHDLYISEESLRKSAHTILNKPLVWIYDRFFDDIGTHDPLEVPCGFVSSDSPIEYKRTEDGRLMMTVVAKIWKKYSGKILSFFQRDGDKPVSVEIEVLSVDQNDEFKMTEIVDFCYAAITVLGTYVTPAIPDAKASVVQFAKSEKKEYQKAYLNEFASRYSGVDFSIPPQVIKNASEGIDLYKKFGVGGTPVGLANARYLLKHDTVLPQKVRQMAKYLSSHADNDFSDKAGKNWIAWQLWGGNDAVSWSSGIVDQMNEADKKKLSYFAEDETYQNKVEIEKENNKEAYSMEDENKEQVQEDPKEEAQEAPEAENKEQEGRENMAVPEDQEDPKEEAEETPEEEAQEQEGDKEKMSLDAYLDVAALLAMLADETEEYQQFAASVQDGSCQMSAVASKMFAKMQQMCDQMKSMSAELESCKQENMSLKEFKAQVEGNEKQFAIDETLKEVEEFIPTSELNRLRELAKTVAFEALDGWKNQVKAVAFSFSRGKKTDDGVIRIGQPFTSQSNKNDSLWG